MHSYSSFYSNKKRIASSKNSDTKQTNLAFTNNTIESSIQRKIQETANNSDLTKQAIQLKELANKSSQNHPIQRKNNTGLPNNLKSGIENLSGFSMDDVKVHYNSNKPAQLQAHAYAQGTDIHLASGQEKHLPHEAWHVVQQKQGRVKPTTQLKGQVNINDDLGLEREADVMGQKSLQMKRNTNHSPFQTPSKAYTSLSNNIFQLIKVTGSDKGQTFKIIRNDNKKQDVGVLKSIGGNGWYTFTTTSGDTTVRGEKNILSKVNTSSNTGGSSFSVSGMNFSYGSSSDYTFTSTSALNATKSLPRNTWKNVTGQSRNSGVKIGDVGSYGGVQYLEKTGDGLTGDHQPSGAAIKEAIRIKLHNALNQPLTRQMAKNAYKKAITVVMTDVWHKATSRTYGGRNNPQQIKKDAANLMDAAIADWKASANELLKYFTQQQVIDIWNTLNECRKEFFSTGDPQYQ